MRSYAGRRSKRPLLALPVLLVGLCLGLSATSHAVTLTDDGTTTVGATVCSTGSSVALIKPEGDSVVTSPTVALEGAVDQASQIEIHIDGAFDSVIPLSAGQTSFTGTVELSGGTHTITVTAVDLCSGNSATDSAVVTYEVPPQTPSTGGDTPTTAGGVTYSGESVAQSSASNTGTGILDAVLVPIKDAASWLNVKIDDGKTTVASLSLARAATFTAGLTLAIIGVAPVVTGTIASSTAVVSFLPSLAPSRRLLFVGALGRILGVVLSIGSLLL